MPITSKLGGGSSGPFDDSDIAAAAAIDATKIANGSVSNTEFQYLDGASSNLQTQISAISSVPPLYIFGSGADGDVTISADTHLTRTMYYNNLTINTGKFLYPDGYVVYVKGTLTLTGTGSIDQSFANGSNAVGATAGAGGSGGWLGNDGATGGNGHSAAVGDDGSAGISGQGYCGASLIAGAGGNGASTNGGAGGAAAPITQILPKYLSLIDWSLYHTTSLLLGSSLSSFIPYGSSAPGGGGGGGDLVNSGGGGGGGGSDGGFIAIYAKTISNAGTIKTNGGNGGNGGNASAGNAGGGGGGSGGGGGLVYIVYQTLTGAGTITATGGTKGTKGTKTGTGVNGVDGSDGAAGHIVKIDISAGTITVT